jgi:hypothetical protein
MKWVALSEWEFGVRKVELAWVLEGVRLLRGRCRAGGAGFSLRSSSCEPSTKVTGFFASLDLCSVTRVPGSEGWASIWGG